MEDEALRRKRAELLSKQPINWAFIDLMTPLPWQTNVFTTSLPFVYRAPSRYERTPAQSQFYAGQRRPREEEPTYSSSTYTSHRHIPVDDELAMEHGEHRNIRPRETPPTPPDNPFYVPLNLGGYGGRNVPIRHPPRYLPDGRPFYPGSTIPPVVTMRVMGEQAQRPTLGAAAAA